jgi:hypothetical protein
LFALLQSSVTADVNGPSDDHDAFVALAVLDGGERVDFEQFPPADHRFVEALCVIRRIMGVFSAPGS